MYNSERRARDSLSARGLEPGFHGLIPLDMEYRRIAWLFFYFLFPGKEGMFVLIDFTNVGMEWKVWSGGRKIQIQFQAPDQNISEI